MSKDTIPEWLRRQVCERAQGRCEYCLIREELVYLPFEVDHIIAEKHGGPTHIDNLAWACPACNRYKGTDIGSLDPKSGRIVLFFNPRKQRWSRHFRLSGARIEPLTANARATSLLLRFNDEWRIHERLSFIALGLYP